MAKKTKKDNKNLIIGICTAAVAIIAIVIAIIFIVKGSGPTLNDDYFKSDDTKYVMSVDVDPSDLDEDEKEYPPIKAHSVYTYSGDEITSSKTYIEYSDASTAEKAFKVLKDSGDEEAKNAELNGKYIIITNDKSKYEDLKASEVKEQIEFYEKLKNMDFGDEDNLEEIDEGEIEDIDTIDESDEE